MRSEKRKKGWGETSENKYLGSYSPAKDRNVEVYWDPADFHRPVLLKILRISDKAFLMTFRRSRKEAGDILEVESILRNAAENGQIPRIMNNK